MRALSAIATLLFLLSLSTASSAVCVEAVVPELPDPDTAVMSDIVRAQGAVKQYLARQEKFLACVAGTLRHDAAVEKMHEVAAEYNNMTRRYKSRMQSMDMVVDLALAL